MKHVVNAVFKMMQATLLSIMLGLFAAPSYSAAVDSTTTNTTFRPKTDATLYPSTAIKPNYTSESVPAPSTITNENYSTLPLCPGRGQIPSSFAGDQSDFICPDINDKWPVMNMGWLGTWDMNIINQTEKDKLCPDYCRVDRITTPVTPAAYPLPTAVAVTSFTVPVCPKGYVKLGDFNLQAAIKYIVPPGPSFVGPFTDWTTYNRYLNDPFYDCSIWYNPFSGVYDYSKFNYLQTRYCSVEVARNVHGPDSPPTYWSDQMIYGYGVAAGGSWGGYNYYIGQYVDWWTWTPNWGYWDSMSYAITDYSCVGPTLIWGGGVAHRDVWLHYFRYQYCKSKPGGWYFVNQLQPASIICGRVKSQWRQRQ